LKGFLRRADKTRSAGLFQVGQTHRVDAFDAVRRRSPDRKKIAEISEEAAP
jgi:hypothetical protein